MWLALATSGGAHGSLGRLAAGSGSHAKSPSHTTPLAQPVNSPPEQPVTGNAAVPERVVPVVGSTGREGTDVDVAC